MAVAGTLEIEVVLNGKKVKMGLDQLKKRMGILQKQANATNKIFSKLAKIVSIGFLAKMTIDASKFGRAMSLLADRTGIATDKLVGMRTAFSAMGGKAGEVDKLIGNISKGLAGLSMGKGEFASKLASMGISAWGAGGKTKSADVVMGDIADWTKQQLAIGRSNAEVASFLEENFGISYEMFQNLKQGRAGMAKQQRETIAKTGVVTNEQLENLNKFHKSLSVLTTTLTVLGQRIAGDIAPILIAVSDILQSIFKEFQEIANMLTFSFKEIIGDTDAADTAIKAFKTALSVVAKIIGGLAYVIMKSWQLMGKVIAWIVDKLGWLFGTSADEKWQSIAADQSQEALQKLKSGEFKNTDEMMKWLADTGNPVWKKRYENYLLEKQVVDENGKNIDVNSIPFRDDEYILENGESIDINSIPLRGDEVMKAGMAGDNVLVANVDVNTEITPNPDGTYSTNTTTEVRSGDNSFVQNAYGVATGGM